MRRDAGGLVMVVMVGYGMSNYCLSVYRAWDGIYRDTQSEFVNSSILLISDQTERLDNLAAADTC